VGGIHDRDPDSARVLRDGRRRGRGFRHEQP
jgi:hypothetical protein